MLLYVSGPYTAKEGRTTEENIFEASVVAVELWRKGHTVICPHTNTTFPSGVPLNGLDWKDWIRGDLAMIARCDGMVMMPGWRESQGAFLEEKYARELGMPIWYEEDGLPELHLTEKRCPEQAKAFAEVVGKMYRTHLDKNADYSPANILLTGDVGLATRLWDKIARILNLTGFDLKVEIGEYSAPRRAMNEALDDAYLDAAVYSIIGYILRKKKWGK